MAEATYGDIEISINRVSETAYGVEARLWDPEDQAERPPVRGEARISRAALEAVLASPAEYSNRLTDQLFEDANVRTFFGEVTNTFDARNCKLRLRILCAPELHRVRWEMLLHPQSRAPLATSEHILLSRFMPTRSWRVAKLRPKAELKALVAVAAPSNIAEYDLAEINAAEECERARIAMAGVEVSELGTSEPLTLRRLMDAISKGPDIVYLVCHGICQEGSEPRVFLQDDAGEVASVKAAELALQFSEVAQLPRLIVLASCESAGSENFTNPMAALSPQLADAGVPAIVAMQSKVGIEAVQAMMPKFFEELVVDGQIDRAMAVARRTVRTQEDAWIPALFLRLRGGRIWYVPGFSGEFKQWDGICRSVRDKTFVPILGPDFGEHVFGSSRMLAYELGQKSNYPFTNSRPDIRKVAQYIRTHDSDAEAQGKVRDALFDKMKAKAASYFGPRFDSEEDPVAVLEALVPAMLRDESDPFRILAEVNAKLYVTTNLDRLLEETLRHCGKEPVELVTHWRDAIEGEQPFLGDPKPEKPFVYYAFGKAVYDDRWILAEDDYFDYLIRTAPDTRIPTVVSNELIKGSLLFLGFPVGDWKFRILFRMIMAKEGRSRLSRYAHVAVQVNPEEHTLADAEHAKRDLERYFSKADVQFDVYWGSAADFLRDLQSRLKKTKASRNV